MSIQEQVTPEHQPSHEQQLIVDLTTTVVDALDKFEVSLTAQEDGSQVRKLGGDLGFSDSLSEVTTPDGQKSYEYSSLFTQTHDRGLMTWSWQEGSSLVHYTAKFEVEGEKDQVINNEVEIERIKSDVDSVISKLTEKFPPKQTRLQRFLGRKALNS